MRVNTSTAVLNTMRITTREINIFFCDEILNVGLKLVGFLLATYSICIKR